MKGKRTNGLWARRMDELSIFFSTEKAYTTYYRDLPGGNLDEANEWLREHGMSAVGEGKEG